MRDILFRAWDKKEKTMNYSEEGRIVDGRLIAFDLMIEWRRNIYSSEWELMQFTGLHDKNGKEIFEGDILTTTYKNRQIRMVVVTWGQWGGGTGFNIREYTSTNYKIIGNIYENPELAGRTE